MGSKKYSELKEPESLAVESARPAKDFDRMKKSDPELKQVFSVIHCHCLS